ncbi:MAG: SIMPL domain-containing protein [Rhodospirillales bacterium]|nr:SIMPL domain-containing protein [Rhodospirillales bacterium]
MPIRFLLLAILLVVAPAALAQDSRPVEPGLTVLRLIETAERALPHDRLRAELRVELAGGDPRRIQAEINQRMGAAVARAKKEAAIKTGTGGYTLYEERPHNAPARWRGRQSVTLTSGDFAALMALAGELQETGLVFSNLAFDLTPEAARAAEDDLTAEALARLRQRAERIAAAMNLAIVRYHDIRVGDASGERPPSIRMLRAEMAGTAAPPPTAEPGEQTVRISVEAEILLGPAGKP